jgi:hypothetical protein
MQLKFAKICQGLKGIVLKKKFVLPIESWISLFFPILCFVHGPTMVIYASVRPTYPSHPKVRPIRLISIH